MGQLFQSFWWGEPLSPYEWLSLKSFIDFGHRFDLYSFDPHIAVPAQVRVRDAAARCAGGRPHLAPVLKEGRKYANVHAVWESSGESRLIGQLDHLCKAALHG